MARDCYKFPYRSPAHILEASVQLILKARRKTSKYHASLASRNSQKSKVLQQLTADGSTSNLRKKKPKILRLWLSALGYNDTLRSTQAPHLEDLKGIIKSA